MKEKKQAFLTDYKEDWTKLFHLIVAEMFVFQFYPLGIIPYPLDVFFYVVVALTHLFCLFLAFCKDTQKITVNIVYFVLSIIGLWYCGWLYGVYFKRIYF